MADTAHAQDHLDRLDRLDHLDRLGQLGQLGQLDRQLGQLDRQHQPGMATGGAGPDNSRAVATAGSGSTGPDVAGEAVLDSTPSPRLDPATLRRSPAQSLASEMAATAFEGPDGVSLREIPFAPQLGIRAEPGGVAAVRVTQVLGVTLPSGVGLTTGDPDGAHIIWISPDEFLMVDVCRTHEHGEVDAVAAALDDDRPGAGRAPGQALDLSGNRAVLELSGSRAREVLEKGCHVDLHPRVFPAGTAVSTLVGPVQMIVHRAHEDTFRLLPRASFAEYTVRWLLDAMLEFQPRGRN